MSFFKNGFDATKVAPQEAFKPIPAGDYDVMVVSAKEEQTRDGSGLMLHVEYQVTTDGQYKGRRLHDRVTLQNKNVKAVEIGQRQLSALCHGTGVLLPKSAAVFCGKCCKVRVEVEKRKDNGGLANAIKGIVLPAMRGAPAAAAPTTATADPWAVAPPSAPTQAAAVPAGEAPAADGPNEPPF